MKLYIFNYLIILLFIIILYYKRHDKYEMGGIIILFLFYLYFYYFYYWPEIYNVTPLQQYEYNNTMVWLNLNNVDVHNPKIQNWANRILVDNAPNILGLQVTKSNISKPELSVLLQRFEILFNHSPKYIYFDKNQGNYIKRFIKNKNIELVEYSIRRPYNSI